LVDTIATEARFLDECAKGGAQTNIGFIIIAHRLFVEFDKYHWPSNLIMHPTRAKGYESRHSRGGRVMMGVRRIRWTEQNTMDKEMLRQP
jgi:hypothetical protein